MADNEKVGDQDGQKAERSVGRLYPSRVGEQRALSKTKHKVDESELPAPPPDPWTNSWRLQNSRNQVEMAQSRNLEEDEDIIAYLTDFGTLPLEGQTSECPSRNSVTSTVAISNFGMEDAFEHLDRLYAVAEQILELRNRNSKFFKRVRNLERLKVLRNANSKLENVFVRDKDATIHLCEEDTGFAESLLDAMLSNCRDSPFQRRNIRSSSSRQTRNKFDIDKQMSVDEISGSAPKVSKWTRVKAAFKWERAYTNDAEISNPSITENVTTPMTAPTIPLLSPTNKSARSSDEIKDPNSTVTLSLINESCNLGVPPGRTSSASSSNEGSYDCSQKCVSSQLDDQILTRRINKKAEYSNWHNESVDEDIGTLEALHANETGPTNEVGQGKPLIRITSEKSRAMHSPNRIDEKDTEFASKRSTPTLTITIPSHEEDIRYTSSPESNSPLYCSTSVSGGNSPQPRKAYRDLPINKDFKRQQSFGGESVIMTSKMQRQDSKWNKVRRAFLTNSALSMPSNLINVVPRQIFFQDGPETSVSCNYDDSIESNEKVIPLSTQADTRQDYRALREKFGNEFHQKLIEWERLKNLSPRTPTKETREISSSLPSPRESLLSEERLAPEFRKKLQDWKRTKKVRRGSAPFEQQRLNRRRLTDWQLWRSSKSEYNRNKDFMGSFINCESAEVPIDGKSQHYEDFIRKTEACRRMNENSNPDIKKSTQSKLHQLGIASGIDESEFIALEKLLLLFNGNGNKGQRESDAQQLDKCFDGYMRPCTDVTQNVNDTNEILVRTSVGSYRFEGISREFTRKLYDWERYRGISPTSSTFRLLGPAYIPFLRQETVETPMDDSPTAKDTSDEPVSFKGCGLKRSKSVSSLMGKIAQDEFYIRRSKSLQLLDHATNKLQNSDRVDTLPNSINPQRTDDVTEDILDDSEPEAMIVDIEDVIEETASPLERVQPHQTPVYSVAASETTSIAVPLGTVTSSHEPSPVFLIELEEDTDAKHWESKKWNQRKSFSSEEDSLSLEQFEMMKAWNDRRNSSKSSDIDLENLSLASSPDKKRIRSMRNDIDNLDEELDEDSVKSNSSINSIEEVSEHSVIKESKEAINQHHANFKREDDSTISLDDDDTIAESVKEYVSNETNEKKTIHEWKLGNRSIFDATIKNTMKSRKMKASIKNRSLFSKISLTIAQSKLATCRYNQELSREEHERNGDDQEGGNEGSRELEKDVDETTFRYGNEYEEINLDDNDSHYCSLINIQSVVDHNEESTKALPKTSASCKLDEAKDTTCNVTFYYTNKEDQKSKKLEERYGVIQDDLHDACDLSNVKLKLNSYPSKSNREEQDNCPNGVVTGTRPVERNEWQEHRNIDGDSNPLTFRAAGSNTQEYRREPTIQTTAYTVAPCREERCYERIIINEETLNKIVVPTASTGLEKIESTERSSKDTASEDCAKERNDRSYRENDNSPNREARVKKQISSSPTRNVFIRTKRIIFSPFRRSEEPSSSKKENNTPENDQVFSIKQKSKSRSGSPKINRQDALLRMSLSLPWPLRPSSKDRETKESKIEGREDQTVTESRNFERSRSVETSRKLTDSENNVIETRIERGTGIFRDRNTSIEFTRKSSELTNSVEQRKQRASISAQATPNERENNTFRISLPSLKTEEKGKETTPPSKFDPQASDLIHKLTILSNAVAKRDGRTNTISEDSSLESHSLRIRRAKEDFLSRRGGPLCHSVLEPPTSRNEDSLTPHYYEPISEKQQKIGGRVAQNVNHTFNLSGEMSRNNTQQEATKEKQMEQFINECNVKDLSDNSAVSRPDRVKSASAGMINVDPDTFVRLTEANRGCESLPRSISKQEQPLGSLAKIVNKFKFTRLIRNKDIQEENMSTISKLCRQSLLIDVKNDFEKRWEANSDSKKNSMVDNVEKMKK